MTHQVSDDQYGKLRRRLDEIARRADQGTIPFDPMMKDLTLIVEGEFPKPRFLRDMAKERGWILQEEGPEHPEGLTVADLKLREFLEYGEKSITGETLQKRAQKLNANFGQHTAEYLLEHQTEIPEEWRKFYLVFPGTVWWAYRGDRDVTCLRWRVYEWHLIFFWLDARRFSFPARLLAPRA